MGGAAFHLRHYGILRLATDSDVHTPRHMVPSGYPLAPIGPSPSLAVRCIYFVVISF